MPEKLKIGEIKYLNCAPLYYMLKRRADCRDYEFVPGEPAYLNGLLAKGEIDVSSSSSIEYARHWREYLVVPDISISSTGDVGSILLFSKKKIESLGGARISVSSASATSTVLLKALLKYRYGLETLLIPDGRRLETMLKDSHAALLIGDEALREGRRPTPEPGLFVYDLGRLWHEFTGKPFVYALWMVREDSAGRAPELARRFRDDILRAKAGAKDAYDDIAGRLPEGSWMGGSALVEYWKAMSYDLSDGHREGLEKFFEMARGVGEVSDVPALRFL